MLCENCQKNEATLHYTKTVNGHKTEQHLCEECASATGASTFNYKTSFMNPELTLGDLLSTILGFPNSYTKANPYTKKDVKCENCGMTFPEFLKKGKFGCNECISAFGSDIDESLKRIHGSDIHIGKRPINYIEKAIRASKTDGETTNNNTNNIDISNENIDNRSTDNININNSNLEVEETRDIGKLEEKLNQALKEEQYEECARLRDKIRGLKEEEKKGEEDS